MVLAAQIEASQTEAAMPLGRPNRIVVDLRGIRANLRALQAHLGAGVQIFTPLKANAYGFGLVPVAKALEAAGAHAISVVDAGDAVKLREAGVRCPILLYGGNLPNPALRDAVLRHHLMPTINDGQSAELFAQSSAPVDVFIKINVGNERFGFVPEEINGLAATLKAASKCRVAGVYAHPHVSPDAYSSGYLQWQFDRLKDAVQRLEARGIPVPLRMGASSQVLLSTGDFTLNAVDPGHLLFGVDTGGAVLVDIARKPALIAFETQIAQLTTPSASPFQAQGPIGSDATKRVAILPLGFADGLDRSNAGFVLIRGQRAPILPRYSAEHSRVDVTALPEVRVGDLVTIIGRQGVDEISLSDIVRHQGQPRHVELTMGFNTSIPRLYRD